MHTMGSPVCQELFFLGKLDQLRKFESTSLWLDLSFMLIDA